MDWYHTLGGFGSYQHARVIPHLYALRLSRTLIEAAGPGWKGGDDGAPGAMPGSAYGQAWNECTRERGLGGCEVFLATSNCTLPRDWKARAGEEREEWVRERGPMPGVEEGWGARVRWLRGRRMVLYTEIITNENTNLLHRAMKLWSREQVREELPPSLAFLSAVPGCWWNAQLLAYLMRTTPAALQRAALLVAQTLQLPHPEQLATHAIAYAQLRQPDTTHIAHSQRVWQTLKLAWQIHHSPHAQHLLDRIRTELDSPSTPSPLLTSTSPPSDDAEGESAVSSSTSPSPLVLLGYSFIRHGDKVTEAELVSEDAYLRGMQRQARLFGLQRWYVGSDDLLSIDWLLAANANASQPLSLFSSPLVAALEDRAHHPFAHGFVWQVSLSLSDAEREALLWRTLLEVLVGAMADVHLSTWSSNHPRLVYELATAVSEARVTMPFQGLDDYFNMNLEMKRESMPEQCR